MPSFELYGTLGCPYTREMREWLEWKGLEFTEFDVELDLEAHSRMRTFASAPYAVPLLVQDGKVVQVGWQGHSCVVSGKQS
jgi:glutaredoxin 3